MTGNNKVTSNSGSTEKEETQTDQSASSNLYIITGGPLKIKTVEENTRIANS